ncbi:MAG: ATP-dependent sacrificial sulfur transferase LarE [Pyrinomonadaceae bacterium]
MTTKERCLRDLMRSYEKVLVAYSGGVDSSYLALIAKQELGKNAVCVLGVSPSVSEFQRNEARSNAKKFSLNLHEIETDEMQDARYAANPTNRCYFCKSELYGKLAQFATESNIVVIVDGTNADDLNDVRPGHAAAKENGVISPLAEVGLSKSEIRQLSRELGIEDWDKPASPCLSSRIAYGKPVTIGRLSQVERAESFLRDAGFREFRVRVHDDLARIELAENESEHFFDRTVMNAVGEEFSRIGFKYVTYDLHGFRSGSMN